MSIDIRRPNITAPTEAGRLEQIRSYLYQVSEQLNWAFSTIESNIASAPKDTAQTGAKTQSPEEVESNFNSVKALIIKSADIVNEYYDQISKRLEGRFTAISDDFGTYKEDTAVTLEANSKNINLAFEDIQEINSVLEDIRTKNIETEAYIKTGILEYSATTGAAVYGLEIGQTNSIDGAQVFDKFARFTADKLSFYDSNDIEVAYISDYKLYITSAEIKGMLTHGGYDIDPTDGIAYIWKGRD